MNINQIKKFSTKSEKYINFYKKIEKISKDLENTPRNKYKILNIIFDNFMSRAFNELYKKDKMYELGAEYASMSGSGSAIYGIFSKPVANVEEHFPGIFCRQRDLI